jgi:hypothetical protein
MEAKAIVETPVPHVLCGRILMQGYDAFVQVSVIVSLDCEISKYLIAFFIRSCEHRDCCFRSVLGAARLVGDR